MYMSVCASVCVCLFTHCTHFAIVWQKKKKKKNASILLQSVAAAFLK